MRVGVVNLGAIVSGDWREPFVEGDALVAADGILEAVGAVEAGAIDACEVVIDAGGANGDSGADRFPGPRHLRRLHAAPEHRGLPYELRPRRHHHGDLGFGGARAGPAERPRRGQGAGGRGVQVLRALPAGRHARARRLHHPGAGADARRLRRRAPGRRLARQGRLRRRRDGAGLRGAGTRRQGGRPAHGRCTPAGLDPRLFPHHRRRPDRHRPHRLLPHQRRAGRHRGPLLRAGGGGDRASPCRSAPPATCAPRCSAPRWRASTTPSTAS